MEIDNLTVEDYFNINKKLVKNLQKIIYKQVFIKSYTSRQKSIIFNDFFSSMVASLCLSTSSTDSDVYLENVNSEEYLLHFFEVVKKKMDFITSINKGK